MTIRARIIACFVILIALFSAFSIWSQRRLRLATERLGWVNHLFLPMSRQVTQLQGHLQSMIDDVRRNSGEQATPLDSSTFSRVVRDLYPYVIQKRFATMERLVNSQVGVDASLSKELSSLIQNAKTSFEKITTATERADFEAVIVGARTALTAISGRIEDECQRVTREIQREGSDASWTSTVLSVLVLCFGLFTIYISYVALKPLPFLVESFKKLGGGDLDQSLKVSPSNKNEIALLAREYNRMLEALRERDKKILSQQKELVQSERLATVGQLSAEVVHEIRNPLNAISLNIDWLRHELASSDEEISKTLSSVSTEIERLNQITESYLVRSRISVSDEKGAPINELWKEILDFEKNALSQTIEIETQFTENEIFVRADRSRLKQAFLNVLKNAKEAMPRGGKISVKTELKSNVTRIEVRDTGHGMNPSTLRDTFKPFFTTKPNGTGLGLMLTKEIVEGAQGTLLCESELGRGTTFVFQFPVFS